MVNKINLNSFKVFLLIEDYDNATDIFKYANLSYASTSKWLKHYERLGLLYSNYVGVKKVYGYTVEGLTLLEKVKDVAFTINKLYEVKTK